MSDFGHRTEEFKEFPKPVIVGFEGKVAGYLRIKAATFMTSEPMNGSLIHPLLVYEFSSTPDSDDAESIALILTESGFRDLGRLTSDSVQAALKAARRIRNVTRE